MAAPYDLSRHLPRVAGLFPLPQVMARAAAKVRDPDASIEDLAAILVLDPSLVSTVIRLSNSPCFNVRTPSATLVEAIQRVGLREIMRLVSCCITEAVYRRELRHYRIPPEVFWESGIAAALLAETLARTCGLPADEAYLAGLMREIGMVVIDHALSAEGDAAQWDCTVPVRDWERSACGHEHPEIGAALLRQWGFPDGVCVAVAGQGDAVATAADLTAVLRLTNLVLETSGCDFSLPLRPDAAVGSALAGLGLDFEQLAAAHTDARERFRALRAEFGTAGQR